MTSSWPELAPLPPADTERESRRNALLRRTDWRFLLPNAHPALSVCSNDGPLREAVVRISGRVTTAATAPPAACDLVVATDPSAEALTQAFALLRPGGSCYVEHRSRVIRPSAVRHALAVAGFEDVRTYWPWPTVDRCHAWLPLDRAATLSAYFRHDEDSARGVLSRTRRKARRAAALLARLAGMTGHVSGVGTKPSSRPDAEAGLLERVRHCWPERRDVSFPPLELVLQTAGERSLNKVVALVYEGRHRHPGIVVKIARIPEAVAGLMREAETLDAVHRLQGLPAGIPRVLDCWREAGSVWVAETALHGRSIADVRANARYRQVAEAATAWLVRLAATSQSASGGLADVCASALRQFETAYGAALDVRLMDAVRRACTASVALPAVLEHRDFAPWNVRLAADGGLCVFDWESSVRQGVPALDLIYFLTYLAVGRNTGRGPKLHRGSYLAAWDPATAAGRVNQQCLARYAHTVGIPASTFGSLRLLTWLIHARSEHERLQADAGDAPARDALRAGLFVSLIEAEAVAYGLEPPR